jgi:hypothetical protein
MGHEGGGLVAVGTRDGDIRLGVGRYRRPAHSGDESVVNLLFVDHIVADGLGE